MKLRLRRLIIQISSWSRRIRPPLFEGLSLYAISRFFVHGIVEGSVTNRAGSIAYSFFLALFPGIIFFFTLIPYFPVTSLESEVYDVFQRILPPDTYEATKDTIEDVLSNRRGGLLSFGFILALIFSTNGVNAIISNFNQTIHAVENRGFFKQLLVSSGLTIVLSINFIVGLVIIIFSSDVLNAVLHFLRLDEISPMVVELSRFGLLVFLVFIGIVLLYNFAPSGKRAWRFFSPGAILATILIIVSSWGFSFYIANFSQYNKLYGSIGTLIVILLWIYINALVLIIGFELNASIAQLKKEEAQLEAKERAEIKSLKREEAKEN